MSRLSVPYSLINRVPKSAPVCYMVKCLQIQPNTQHSNQPSPLVNGITSSFISLHIRVNTTRLSSHIIVCHGQEFNGDISEDEFSDDDIELDSYSHSLEKNGGIRPEEMQRRRKIGRANKGKIPWNKGKKHSEETRELIRQRTKEALRDPKVRKKMGEGHRPHSKQTRARIRASLRRIWGERMKCKQSREKFVYIWAESIAKSAKKGGIDEDELDWDSYEKIKDEIALEQIQRERDKAKAKEMSQIRAERAAQVKAEKTARIAEKRQEKEMKAKSSGEMINTQRKSKAEKEELAIAQELKLKARLTKIRRKKSSNRQITSQGSRTWERLDPEFIKKERIRKQVSLADQIRAVKNTKAQVMGRQNLTASSIYAPGERSAE